MLTSNADHRTDYKNFCTLHYFEKGEWNADRFCQRWFLNYFLTYLRKYRRKFYIEWD